MPNVLTRREHNGAAPSTTLSSPIASGSDTTFVIASGTNWPTGSTGVFIVTIDRGQATEERILCASRTGTTITVTTRGYDGTTAQAHAASATVEHTTAGVELDELNLHGNSTSGVHGVAGNVVGTSDSQTLSNKAVALGSNTVSGTKAQFNAAMTDADFATLDGTETLTNKTLTSPAINGATADAASTIGGVSGTSLAADRTAWTSWSPTFSNLTSPAGDFYYKLVGKQLYLRGSFTGGTVTASSTYTVSLPASLTAVAGTVATKQFVPGLIAGLGTAMWTVGQGTGVLSQSGTAGQALSGAGFTGVIEVA